MDNHRKLPSPVWLFIVTAIILQGVASQQDQQDPDRCLISNIKVQENFNLDKYLGKWYELKWIPENWFPPEYNYKDFVVDYIKVNDTYVNISWIARETDEDAKCIGGTNLMEITGTPGKFKYHRKQENISMISDYWVVLTDYDNYALVWGCREVVNEICTKEDSWVWSRRPELSENQMNVIDAKITEVCLNHTAFFLTDQINECTGTSSASNSMFFSLSAMVTLLLVSLFKP